MNQRIHNPHPFDMNSYFSGEVFVIGGRDYEREDQEEKKNFLMDKPEQKIAIELDWSFLHLPPQKNKPLLR